MESIRSILDLWSIESERILKEKYIAKGLKASGQFGDSLRHDLTDTSSTIFGAKQIDMMMSGRHQNAKQDDESLRKWVGWAGSTFLSDWVKDKGLSLSSYAVAWKIAREGVKVPNQHNDGKLLNEVFTSEHINSLTSQIGRFFATEITSNIKKSWLQ